MSLKVHGKLWKIDSFEVGFEKKYARIRLISYEGPARSTDWELSIRPNYNDKELIHAAKTEVDNDISTKNEIKIMEKVMKAEMKAEMKQVESKRMTKEVAKQQKKSFDKKLKLEIENLKAKKIAKIVRVNAEKKVDKIIKDLKSGNVMKILYSYLKIHPQFEGAVDA